MAQHRGGTFQGANEISRLDYEIRPCRATDEADLYQICLATGESGQDASAIYKDPKIIGHIYALAPIRVSLQRPVLSPRTLKAWPATSWAHWTR